MSFSGISCYCLVRLIVSVGRRSISSSDNLVAYDAVSKERDLPPGAGALAPPPAGGPGRGALLSELVIDAWGTTMMPSGAATGAADPRYYLSATISPILGTPERVPAKRLDACVVAILQRIRLLTPGWRYEDLRAVLRRVVVLEDAIVLHLEKRVCLTAWRSHEPILQRITVSHVLRLIATCLAKGEEISEVGTALCLKTPRHTRARKIRKHGPRSTVLFKHQT